jgi:hypothetical protein
LQRSHRECLKNHAFILVRPHSALELALWHRGHCARSEIGLNVFQSSDTSDNRS